jgi:hypothetical protein
MTLQPGQCYWKTFATVKLLLEEPTERQRPMPGFAATAETSRVLGCCVAYTNALLLYCCKYNPFKWLQISHRLFAGYPIELPGVSAFSQIGCRRRYMKSGWGWHSVPDAGGWVPTLAQDTRPPIDQTAIQIRRFMASARVLQNACGVQASCPNKTRAALPFPSMEQTERPARIDFQARS